MAKGFSAEADVRTFNLFAALNAGGYDFESNRDGMHPIRLAVREALKGIDSPSARGLAEIAAKAHQSILVVWAMNHDAEDPYLQTGIDVEEYYRRQFPEDDPRFDFMKPLFARIPELLTAARTELPLRELWEQYRPAHEREAELCREPGARQAAELEAYLRPKAAPAWSLIVVPCFPDSYYCGYSVDAGSATYVVQGPLGRPGSVAVTHEYAHRFVNPIVEAQESLLSETASLLAKYADRSDPMHAPYYHWPVFVSENLVEAVSLRSGSRSPEDYTKLLKHMTDVRHMTLVERFLEPLSRFEKSGQHYEDFFPGMLEEVLRSL